MVSAFEERDNNGKDMYCLELTRKKLESPLEPGPTLDSSLSMADPTKERVRRGTTRKSEQFAPRKGIEGVVDEKVNMEEK